MSKIILREALRKSIDTVNLEEMIPEIKRRNLWKSMVLFFFLTSCTDPKERILHSSNDILERVCLEDSCFSPDCIGSESYLATLKAFISGDSSFWGRFQDCPSTINDDCGCLVKGLRNWQEGKGEAIEWFDKGLRLPETHCHKWLWMLKFELLIEQKGEMHEECLDFALELDSCFLDAISYKLLSKNTLPEDMNRLLKRECFLGSDYRNYDFVKVFTFIDLDELNEAESYLTGIPTKDYSSETWYLLSEVKFQQQQLEESKKYAQKSLEVSSEQWEAALKLGHIYELQDSLSQSDKFYYQAIVTNRSPYTGFEVFMHLYKTGRFEEGRGMLEELMDEFPGNLDLNLLMCFLVLPESEGLNQFDELIINGRWKVVERSIYFSEVLNISTPESIFRRIVEWTQAESKRDSSQLLIDSLMDEILNQGGYFPK